MRIRLFSLLAVIVILTSCSGTTSSPVERHLSGPTFEASWNLSCLHNNFASPSSISKTPTFGDLYSGDDFETDIEAMHIFISIDLGYPSGLEGVIEVTKINGFFDVIGE